MNLHVKFNLPIPRHFPLQREKNINKDIQKIRNFSALKKGGEKKKNREYSLPLRIPVTLRTRLFLKMCKLLENIRRETHKVLTQILNYYCENQFISILDNEVRHLIPRATPPAFRRYFSFASNSFLTVT